MKDATRARWIARFDMEDLISSILWRGTILSISLIVAGLILQWTGGLHQDAAAYTIQGTNVFHFILANLPQRGSITVWPALFIHWGIGVLLFTPYVRVVASVLYFAYVHRSWKHTLLGGFVLAPLTYIVFFG